MKTAIVYYSQHHGNTRKLLDAIAEKNEVNIKGQIVFVGAEDDVLWDTCRYIRSIQSRKRIS